MLPPDVEVKEIPGCPHYYVSKDGRVWSEKRGYKTMPYFDFGQWLKPKPFRGYLTVGLYVNKKLKRFKIHHLVLLTYVGPRPPDHIACHWDADKLNSHLDNLSWVTRQEHPMYQRMGNRRK